MQKQLSPAGRSRFSGKGISCLRRGARHVLSSIRNRHDEGSSIRLMEHGASEFRPYSTEAATV